MLEYDYVRLMMFLIKRSEYDDELMLEYDDVRLMMFLIERSEADDNDDSD